MQQKHYIYTEMICKESILSFVAAYKVIGQQKGKEVGQKEKIFAWKNRGQKRRKELIENSSK
jgi:hypothetical protein